MKTPFAVTFDFGQVLASFDANYLTEKLIARGLTGEASRFEAALPEGWRVYGESLRKGALAEVAWKELLRVILEAGAVAATPELLDDLFREQKHQNLWRRPVPGMIELAQELRAEGVAVGVLSNSEGGILDLLRTLGWENVFAAVADSGVLGMEKPHAPIFRWTAERLGVPVDALVHIGDSWVADIEGAMGVEARAIWFLEGIATAPRCLPRNVRFAQNADDVRAALREFRQSVNE